MCINLSYSCARHSMTCTYLRMYIFLHSGIAPLVNGVGMVTINELMCEVTYTITAGGTLNGILVGPRSSHGNITAGYCPIVMTTTSIATTTTMTGKENMCMRMCIWY